MPGIEKQKNYYSIRIRDYEMFEEIAMPQWSSHAATQMGKQWVMAHVLDKDNPEKEIPQKELERVENLPAIKLRHGRLPNSDEWLIQSILIPISWKLKEKDIAALACYITYRLDKRKTNEFCVR